MDIRIISSSTIGTPVPPPADAVPGREADFDAIVMAGDAKKNFTDGMGSASVITVEPPNDGACDEQALVQEDERLSAAEELLGVPVEDYRAESRTISDASDQEVEQVATDRMPDASDVRVSSGQPTPFAGEQATKGVPADPLITSPAMHQKNVVIKTDTGSAPPQESAMLDISNSNADPLASLSDTTTTSIGTDALALGDEDDGAPALVARPFRPETHQDAGAASPKNDRNSAEFTRYPTDSKGLSAMPLQGTRLAQTFAQDGPAFTPNESQVRQTLLVAAEGEPSGKRAEISVSGNLMTGSISGSSLPFDVPDQTLSLVVDASTEQLPPTPDRARTADTTLPAARFENNQAYAFGILNTPETAKISQPMRDWRIHFKTASAAPAEPVVGSTGQVHQVDVSNSRSQPMIQTPTPSGDQSDPHDVAKLATSDLVVENVAAAEQHGTTADPIAGSLLVSARLNPEPTLLSNLSETTAKIPPQQQLADQIIRSMNSTGETELVLAPEELGRVRFAISQEDGAITISITAERADTLVLLRRNSEMLSAELAQAGLAGASIDFGGSGRERDGTRAPLIERVTREASDTLPDDPPASRTKRQTGATGRLDLRL